GDHQVHLAMYQGVQTHGSDGAKQQAEDAAHHGNGNRLESRTELAYKGQQNRAYRCPGHHPGIEVLGQYHGAGHCRVGRIGGTAHHGRGGSRQTISQEGAVQAGLLDEVLAGDRADHHYIPNMFDHRGNGDRNHKQDGGPLKGGGDEVRHGQPGSCSDLGGVYDAEREGQAIADGHAEQDGQQSEDTPSQNRDDDGREQGGTIAGVAHGHVGGMGRQAQTDHHNDRANDHRWQQAVDKVGSPKSDQPCKEHVEDARSNQATEGGRESELGVRIQDGGDEGEG